jgi:polysaccharide export outer membrane protein
MVVMTRLMRPLLVLLALASVDCAPSAPYVWVDSYTPAFRAPEPYRVQPGDKLSVMVWNQPQLSGSVVVRLDGSASLPLVGDVALAGLTPADAAASVATRLKGLIVDPNVTINVAEPRTPTVTVMGEVRTPGVVPLQPGEGVLQVLARAGGTTPFASRTGVYVVRPGGVRIRFDLERMKQGGGAFSFQLTPGDVVMVE